MNAPGRRGLPRQRATRPSGDYLVGERVFARHGATGEHVAGYVVAVDHDQPFPYVLDVGGSAPLHLLASEIESDLPATPVSADGLFAWLTAGSA